MYFQRKSRHFKRVTRVTTQIQRQAAQLRAVPDHDGAADAGARVPPAGGRARRGRAHVRAAPQDLLHQAAQRLPAARGRSRTHTRTHVRAHVHTNTCDDNIHTHTYIHKM